MSVQVSLHSTGPVLLVEDSPEETLIATWCYKRSRLRNPLQTLASGQALLTHIERVLKGTEPLPAMILLDINMPDVNGFETLDQLRRCAYLDEVPVLMLTNSDSPSDLRQARELGADGFQTKPLMTQEFIAFFDSLAS